MVTTMLTYSIPFTSLGFYMFRFVILIFIYSLENVPVRAQKFEICSVENEEYHPFINLIHKSNTMISSELPQRLVAFSSKLYL